MIDRIIAVDTGHIKIQRAGMVSGGEMDVIGRKLNWDEAIQPNDIIEQIVRTENDKIETISRNIIFTGMLYSNGRSTRGFRIIGIEPKNEHRLQELMPASEGTFLTDDDMKGIYISSETASLLDAGINDIISITCSTVHGAINVDDFTVCGIFKDSAPWHAYNSYIHLEAARNLLDTGDKVMEIRLFLKKPSFTNSVAHALRTKYDNKKLLVKVKTWKQAGKFYLQSLKGTDGVIGVVYFLLFIIIFGIVMETMVMLIRERMYETGTLRAMGTGNGLIYRMFLSEFGILSLLAMSAGLIVAGIVVLCLNRMGINVTGAFSFMVGGNKIFPVWSWEYILKISIIIFVITLVAGYFPLKKALKVQIVEALRNV